MKTKLIYEIGDLIHIRNTFSKTTLLRRLKPGEIIKTKEYLKFKAKYPGICYVAEN